VDFTDGMVYASIVIIAVSLISVAAALVLRLLVPRKLYIISAIAAGIVIGLALFFAGSLILQAFRVEPYIYAISSQSVRSYAFALPTVTLSMASGFLLLTKGRYAQYFIVKTISIALFLGAAYFAIYRLAIGSQFILINVPISELAAAALFLVFAGRSAKHTTNKKD
jgi:Na+-driven multidrug efflux pump